MEKINDYWLGKLVNTLSVQTNSQNEKLMVLFLDKALRKLKLNYTIDEAGNVIVTKGKTGLYPCIISHMDTVHSFAKGYKVYMDADDNDILFAINDKNQRVGVGGDDKCGVFACLYFLETLPSVKTVFFSREERGCVGSNKIDRAFFKDCAYIIQLDRREDSDFIQSYCGNKTVSHEFASEVGAAKKQFGYKTAIGTVTDVMKLFNERVGISCVNISCGYYKAHTSSEYVSISALWKAIQFTQELISTLKLKKYVAYPPKIKYKKQSTWVKLRCANCTTWVQEMYLYKHTDGKKYCWPCLQVIKEEEKDLPETTTTKGTEDTAEDTTTNNNIILLPACHECGKTWEELKTGETLSSRNKQLYCPDCLSLFEQPNHTSSEKKHVMCYMCGFGIPKDEHPILDKKMLAAFNMYVYTCKTCNKLYQSGSDEALPNVP